jgi:hypothetical protein
MTRDKNVFRKDGTLIPQVQLFKGSNFYNKKIQLKNPSKFKSYVLREL